MLARRLIGLDYDCIVVAPSKTPQKSGDRVRNGCRYKGKSNWSEPHMRYLRELVMPHHAQKMVLEEYLLRIDTATAQLARINDQMELLLENWSRRPFVEAPFL